MGFKGWLVYGAWHLVTGQSVLFVCAKCVF